jgi:transmembrane sensor
MNKNIEILYKAYFEGKLPEDLTHEVQRSLFDKANRVVSDAVLEQIWNEFPPVNPTFQTKASYRDLEQRLNLKPRTISHGRMAIKCWLRLAALWVLPLLSVSVVAYLLIERASYTGIAVVDRTVPIGERENVTLPDGSVVFLNSGSVLLYPEKFAPSNRTVFLSGEGYFSVKKDKKRPFIVNTRYQSVEVSGTVFNLNAYPESRRVVTTLEEGTVEVCLTNRSREIIHLKSDQCLVYDPVINVYSLTQINARSASKWRYGELVFKNSPFNEIIDALARTYGMAVVYQNTTYNSNNLTISLNKDESLAGALFLIKETIPEMRFEIKDKTIYIR